MANQHAQIPVVDFGPVLRHPDDPSAWTATVQQLDDALSSIGFVYLTSHGVPAASVRDAFSAAKSFFTLSQDVKALYTKRFATAKGEGDLVPADYNGYVPVGDEVITNLEGRAFLHEIRESFDILDAPEVRVYPSSIHAPNFQPVMESLFAHFSELAVKLSEAIAVALLGPERIDFFRQQLRGLKDPSVPSMNQIRLLFYPEIGAGTPPARAQTAEGGAGFTRCFEHSDVTIFTFLAQDGVGGLEVKGVDGGWVPAPPVEGALLVNTGDFLQFWSGGHYPATVHRVRIPATPLNDRVHAPARQSMTFFVYPDNDVNVRPLKTKFSDAVAVADTSGINAEEYVMGKLRDIYRPPSIRQLSAAASGKGGVE